MTPTERLADDLRRHAVDLDRVAGSVRQQVMADIQALEDQLAGIVASSDPTRFTSPTDQAYQLQTLSAVIQAVVGQHLGSIEQTLREALAEVADHAADVAASLLAQATGGLPQPADPHAVDEAADPEVDGAKLTPWFAALARDLTFRLTRSLRTVIVAGGSLPDMLAKVRGGAVGGGALAQTRRGADMVARTAVHAAGNHARMAAFDSGATSISGYTHASILDLRTGHECQARAGLTWNAQQEPQGHDLPFIVPPIHPYCRSMLVPILGADAPIEDVSFDEWLGRQDPGYQKEVLGPARYRLWKSGSLRQSDLVDHSGRPLTVAELKVRHG